jgi:hypothetical protein
VSGGTLDYLSCKFEDAALAIETEPDYVKQWPMTCKVMAALLRAMSRVEHSMDWDVAGDAAAERSDNQMTGDILIEFLRVLPDEWFPKGKWATIQASQQRTGL